MKKRLVLICLALFYCFSLLADGFVVQNYLGINCITYQVEKEESFYQVAQKFFVRPSTLALVNNISDVEEIRGGEQLYIPLTETNFYQTKGVSSSKFAFTPVQYTVLAERDLTEIANEFYVSTGKLKAWNQNLNSNEVTSGQKILVGWVKLENKELLKSTPKFIQKEKIVYGNLSEKKEAKEALKKTDLATAEKRFPDYSIPTKSLPEVEPTNVNLIEKDETKGEEKTRTNKKSTSAKLKVVKLDKVDTKEVKVSKLSQKEIDFLKKEKYEEPEINGSSTVVQGLKKMTRNSYSRDKEKLREANTQRVADQKALKRREAARKLALQNKRVAEEKGIKSKEERNAEAKRKAKTEKEEELKKIELQALRRAEEEEKEKLKREMLQAKKDVAETKQREELKKLELQAKRKAEQLQKEKRESDELQAKRIEAERLKSIKDRERAAEKIREVTKETRPDKVTSAKPKVIDKSGQQDIEKNELDKSDDPLYLENKLQRLTLLKSTKGPVSFFYAGTAGAKFYVFTNLANKGGIIKITNLSNGRYILAEVIGPIPEEDRKRGYILKLSDNSKLLLQVEGKRFSSKVNY